MNRTTFQIPKMDCPAEEQIVRMALDGVETINKLAFDLEARTLRIEHTGDAQTFARLIYDLNFEATLTGTERDVVPETENNDHAERQALQAVFAINFSFFIIELGSGIIARSMGLIADSLDMLADAVVYALSLFAVGAAATRKKSVARIAGYFQLILALLGFVEVVRRFGSVEQPPDFAFMIGVSALAMIANIVSLKLILSAKSKEAHMQASMIFTSNDILINGGVILAGAAVYFTGSRYPDLIIGAIIFVLVIEGAIRILKLAR